MTLLHELKEAAIESQNVPADMCEEWMGFAPFLRIATDSNVLKLIAVAEAAKKWLYDGRQNNRNALEQALNILDVEP